MRASRLKAAAVAVGSVMAVTAGLGTGVGVVLAQKPAAPPVAKAEPARPEPPKPADPPPATADRNGLEALERAVQEIEERVAITEMKGRLPSAQERLLRDEIADMYERARLVRAERLNRGSQLRRFASAVREVKEVAPLLREYWDAKQAAHSPPGGQPAEPATADKKVKVEQLEQKAVDAVVNAIPSVGFYLPPWVQREEGYRRLAKAVVTQADFFDGVSDEEVALQERIDKLERELDRGRSPEADLTGLREASRLLKRELLFRKLRAEGVTLSESARGGGGPDPATVADKLDQILRELAALRSEVRAGAAAKK